MPYITLVTSDYRSALSDWFESMLRRLNGITNTTAGREEPEFSDITCWDSHCYHLVDWDDVKITKFFSQPNVDQSGKPTNKGIYAAKCIAVNVPRKYALATAAAHGLMGVIDFKSVADDAVEESQCWTTMVGKKRIFDFMDVEQEQTQCDYSFVKARNHLHLAHLVAEYLMNADFIDLRIDRGRLQGLLQTDPIVSAVDDS